MKRNLNFWLALFGALLLPLAVPQKCRAVSACLSARFNDYNDLGCHVTPCRPGSPASGMSNPGGNQAVCVNCEGMPRWWVTEPYVDLWVADEPLSYTTSSGQRMTFRWTYRERGLLYNTPWAGREYESLGLPGKELVVMRYSENTGGGKVYMTNASWQHNWWSEIVFWDPYIETNLANTGVTYQSGSDPNIQTNAYVGYTGNYQGLLYRGTGGTIYFDESNEGTATTSAQVQIQVINQTNINNGPQIPYSYQNFYTDQYFLPYPQAGTFFVTNPFSGFKVFFPDGSQDIYGLVLAHADVTTYNNTSIYGPPPKVPRHSTASAYLTERIDPQGHVSLIGYLANTNVVYAGGSYTTNFLGYTVQYVVDSDGRTNTYNYSSTNFQQLVSITDPFGRSAQFTPQPTNGLAAITDAQANTTSFSYSTNHDGWLASMTTPYGTTSFTNYSLQESEASNEFEQRAIYVLEPDGAQQLFYYVHQATNGVPASATSPTNVPGQTFDNGTGGLGSTPHYHLTYRDTFHWGQRQFTSLSAQVTNQFYYLQNPFTRGNFNFANTLSLLTTSDFQKAHLKHWMLAPDDISVTETLSCERDPSIDAAGQIPGAWTWYGNGNNSSYPEIDQGVQVSAVAQLLPDGTTQYTRYNYFSYGSYLPSDNESSYSLPNGALAEITNWFNYAANGIDLVNTSNSAGQSVNYAYNANHEVTFITNALNQVAKLAWDSNTFNLTNVTLFSGQNIGFNYYPTVSGPYPLTNTSALLQQIIVQPENRTVTIADYTNGLPRIVHVSGTGIPDLWVTNAWDGLNRPTGTTYQDNTTVSNIYTFLDLTAQKDRLGNWTYFGYDGLQHLTSITNANTNVTTLDWCGCGALTEIIDALTNITTLNYDNQGRLTNVGFPDTSSLTYQYDLVGRMTNLFDGANRHLLLTYNNQGLVTNVSNAYGTVRQTVYDAINRPISTTDANGITVTNSFDLLNRILSRTWLADNIGEKFVYATNGLVAYTNRDGQGTEFARDTAGRLTAITNADQKVTQFTYNAYNQVTNLIDGLTHPTTWSFNQYGWMTKKVDASNNVALLYAYDANGRVTNRWTPASTNTSYYYDLVGNLTNTIYSGSPALTLSYAYDALNRLTNMIDAVGTTAFKYTSNGQLASESYPLSSSSGTISYVYTQGLRSSLTINSSTPSTINYSYDNAWRLQTLTSPAGSFGYGYAASASALVQSITLPNAAYITNTYDSLARLKSTSLDNYWGHVLDGYTYGLDHLGLRTNVLRNLGLTASSVTAGYDNIGQLTSWNAQETNGTSRLNEQLEYGFDAAGNLQSRTNGALAQTFNVDSLNQLSTITRTGTLTLSGATPAPATSVTVNGNAAQTNGDFTFAMSGLSLANGSNTFTIVAHGASATVTNVLTANLPATNIFQYDGNGNLTNDGIRTFVYDGENQLTNVYVAGQWRTDFVYDGLRRKRITREYSRQSGNWSKTNETRYLYDGMLPIQERGSNNAVLVTYTRGLDLSGSIHGAGGIGGLLARTDGNGSSFYHADGAGNITALMDGNQNITARYEYDPFGKLIGKWGSMADANLYRFSSKEYQRNSGLYSFGFRFYEPNFQRWLNRDPIQESGGINLYGFVGNNSMKFVDPLGLAYGDWWDPRSYFNDGWQRYYYTGDPNAPDDVYNGALDAGADWIQVASPVAQNALGATAMVDPTGLSLGTYGFLAYYDLPDAPHIPTQDELNQIAQMPLEVEMASKCPKERTPAENKKARSKFKNNKDKAKEAWEKREGRDWPQKDGVDWQAHHPQSLKSGGDPMYVVPQNPNGPDPHNIPGPDGKTDYQIWGAQGAAARNANK